MYRRGMPRLYLPQIEICYCVQKIVCLASHAVAIALAQAPIAATLLRSSSAKAMREGKAEIKQSDLSDEVST